MEKPCFGHNEIIDRLIRDAEYYGNQKKAHVIVDESIAGRVYVDYFLDYDEKDIGKELFDTLDNSEYQEEEPENVITMSLESLITLLEHQDVYDCYSCTI